MANGNQKCLAKRMVALLCALVFGCEAKVSVPAGSSGPSGPRPVILEDKSEFRGDEYALTIRNSGGAGTVSAFVTIMDDPPKAKTLYGTDVKTQYFAAGEERTLMFPVPDKQRGKPRKAKIEVQGLAPDR